MARRFVVGHEDRVWLLALAGALPAVVLALWLLWRGDASPRVEWTWTTVIVLAALGFSGAARERVSRPLRTLANVLEAMREGDYSMRARPSGADDALGATMAEVNTLSGTLHAQRLGALEAMGLLRTLMDAIEVAIFAFDEGGRLQLVNREGLRLLGSPRVTPLYQTATALGLEGCLLGSVPRRVELRLPGGSGPRELRRGSFRQEGLSQRLVVLSDLRRALRDEERQAWQRLVRVLGHELNNSLAPIHSIAENLRKVSGRTPRAADFEEDLAQGLEVIARRSAALSRFMGAYAELARLPPPQLAPVSVRALLERVAGLELRAPVVVVPGPELGLMADEDQVEQALINLVRNAVDATRDSSGGVFLSAVAEGDTLVVRVLDEGPGLAETANLFVPFFTTKPQGSGIGLVLSRQIAEAHDGTLELKNRSDRTGCEALLRLPRQQTDV